MKRLSIFAIFMLMVAIVLCPIAIVSQADGVVDLTGTTWEISSITATGWGKNVPNLSRVFDEDMPADLGYNITNSSSSGFDNSILALINVNGTLKLVGYAAGDQYTVGSTLRIIGGDDSANSTLIAWLEANATQVIEDAPSAGVVYNLTLPIVIVFVGAFITAITFMKKREVVAK